MKTVGIPLRSRLEDLGRICVLLENLLDIHEEFYDIYSGRNKDFVGWFDQLEKERKDEILRSLIYDRFNLQENIYKILEIAKGSDPLNEQEI